MEEKLNQLYQECLNELKLIGINLENNKEIGKIDIALANRKTKRYGCCKQEEPDKKYKIVERRGYKKFIKYEKYQMHHIEISKWVMQLDDSIIKNTIFHELIHCIPYCNNHGEQFKKYANYINQKLGYNIKRVGDPKEDYEKSNLPFQEENKTYKYKIQCQKCGQEIYRQRFNAKLIKKYRCGKCGGTLELLSKTVNNYT